MAATLQVARSFFKDAAIQYKRLPGRLRSSEAEYFVRDNVLKNVQRARTSLDTSSASERDQLLYEIAVFEGTVYTDLAERQQLHAKRREFAHSAINALQSALNLQPTQEVHYRLGLAFSALYNAAEAHASFDRAIEMDSESKWGIEAAKAKQKEGEGRRLSLLDWITGIFSGNL